MLMHAGAAEVTIKAWESAGVLLEHYAYTAGAVEPIPEHTHPEYQFSLSLDSQGECHYQGAWQPIPKGRLCIVHPGEAHAPSAKRYVSAPASYWMMYADPAVLQAVAAEVAGREAGSPFFESLFFDDADVAANYLHLHRTMQGGAPRLEQDAVLLALIARLVMRHGQTRPPLAPAQAARLAVLRVRDYLHAHYAENISLAQLAEVVQLSRFHLCRSFRKEVGVSPHVYQMQIRIERAKRLLSRGGSIAEAASLTGFYDQSHFGLHFKRWVGTTPGHYRGGSNIVLDEPAAP